MSYTYSIPLPDFGIAGHFIDRVVDVHCVLDHGAVLKHLDLLGHTSNSKVVTVTVKLNTETQVRIVSRRMEITQIEMFLCCSLLQWIVTQDIIKPACFIQNVDNHR